MPSSRTMPDVARFSTYVGRGAIRFYLPLNVQLPNDFFTQSVIVAKDVKARERLRDKLEKVLADDFPSVIARIYPLELGPPVGWPVQYRVSGPDVAEVREIAFEARPNCRRQTKRLRTSISTGSSQHGSCAFISTRMRRAFWG